MRRRRRRVGLLVFVGGFIRGWGLVGVVVDEIVVVWGG